MDLYKKVYRVIFFIFFVGIFLFNAPPVGAFFLTDWLTNAKDFVVDVFAPKPKSEFTVDSTITLAPDGDYDKNGEIDSGDIVTFNYAITNPTKNEYPFATLLTNIPRNNLNFIHDVKGTASLSDENDTITIPNLRIAPQGEVIISFNARINYSSEDVTISTEPEVITKDRQQLKKSPKTEKRAKSWKGKEFPNMMERKDK